MGVAASGCVIDNTDDGFLGAPMMDDLSPDPSPDFSPEADDGNNENVPEPEPAFRFVLVEDLTAEPSGDFPGADVDAISLIKFSGDEFFAQSLGEDSDVACDGNLACDASALLGAPDVVDNGECFGGGAPDGSDFTALNGGFVVVGFSSLEDDPVIEVGDSVHVFEIGATECGRFDDDPFRVSVSISAEISGAFIEVGAGGQGENIIPVTGL